MSGQLPLVPGQGDPFIEAAPAAAAVLAAGQGSGGPQARRQAGEPSEARVRTLAGTLAGYRWPGQAGKLRKGQQAAAERVARAALLQLAEEDD